ncbi:MAG: hypothetical protein OEZ52_14575 [Candidatus Aminicenantes bacterium]|nr:hypothetical protein [Candidatus Aminicenantes bacterium]
MIAGRTVSGAYLGMLFDVVSNKGTSVMQVTKVTEPVIGDVVNVNQGFHDKLKGFTFSEDNKTGYWWLVESYFVYMFWLDFNRKNKTLLVVFPAIQAYMAYSAEELDKEFLKKSSYLVKKRSFNFSDVHSVRVFSEEVHLQKMISDFGDY